MVKIYHLKGIIMLNSRKVEYINNDIEKLKNYYAKCSLRAKEQIREKWIFTELKKVAVESECKYLQKAYSMIQGEDIYRAQEALEYLESLNLKLSYNKELHLHIFKALLNELLFKYVEASIEYKKCNFDKYAMRVYRDFIKRTKDIKTKPEIEEQEEVVVSSVVDSDDIEKLEKSAKSLEAIAKYYARSKQSLDLAKNYFKQALSIYKKIFDMDLNYTKSYIMALIKACETYKLPKSYLDEAESVLFHSNRCKDAEFYLLNKIRILKERC